MIRHLPLVLSFAVHPSLAAQGFTLGDLYLKSPAVDGASSADGGVVRIDPATGTAQRIVDFEGGAYTSDSIAYDPYRDGLVFTGVAGNALNPQYLYLADAQGNLKSMGFQGTTLGMFAPTGDGRIYLQHVAASRSQVRYLDANGQLHVLLDQSGSQPFDFSPPGGFFQYSQLLYHVETNSLVALANSAQFGCAGQSSPTLNLRRAQLSADGSRVVGPVTCGSFEVSTSGEAAVGLSRLPDGDLLAVVDTNSNATEPRMVRIDPRTLTAVTFAANGHAFAAATNAGTFSTIRGQAVVLDTGNDVLRAFTEGTSGAGTVITPSRQVSSPGGSGELATLIEISEAPCAGELRTYGAGLAGSGGYVPSLTASGCPRPGQTTTLHVASALGGASGIVVFGALPAAVSLLGGTLLVTPALSIGATAGGTSGQPGAGWVDISVAVPAAVPVGARLYVQALFLDGAAPAGVSFTGGLAIRVG